MFDIILIHTCGCICLLTCWFIDLSSLLTVLVQLVELFMQGLSYQSIHSYIYCIPSFLASFLPPFALFIRLNLSQRSLLSILRCLTDLHPNEEQKRNPQISGLKRAANSLVSDHVSLVTWKVKSFLGQYHSPRGGKSTIPFLRKTSECVSFI